MVLAITTGKQKRSSRLSGGLSVFGSGGYDRKKKRYSREKKKIQSSVCWVRGSGDYDRKKKIQSSVWRVVVSVFGSGGKLAVFLLWPEKKVTVVCLAGCAVVSVFGSGGK